MPGIADTNRLSNLYAHITTQGIVYPSMAAGATVVSAAADWTLGAYATIVAAGVITDRFHIHSVTIETCDKNAVFELELYYGATDIPLGSVRFSVSGGFFGNAFYTLDTRLIGPGNQVRARLASSDGLANQATITISITYCVEA